MGVCQSAGHILVPIRPNSRTETETLLGDIDYKGRTPRVRKDRVKEEHADFTDTTITGHNNSFNSSESTNGNVQTIPQDTEHSIIDNNDTEGNSENYEQTDSITTNEGKETKKKKKKKKGGPINRLMNDIPQIDQLESGPVSQDKSDTASCPNVQTTNFENCEQTVPKKKTKKKKGSLTRLGLQLSKEETTQCWPNKEENTGVKNKMRPEPSEPMKAGTTENLFKQQDENGVKDKISEIEQQVKVMTMETERLAERCRFDSETSKNASEELQSCPKAFIQSINSVEEYISHSILENSKLTVEKNEYLNRLSSAAGAKLTDNNPNITNLHDPNRPMKLADKFNKIYDDEWTDMIERLEKTGPETEKHKDKCVYHLYSVLIVIFNSLSKKSEVQLKGLAKHLFLLTKPSTEQIHATWDDYKEERVQLIVSRKKTAVTTILMLYQNLQTDPIFVQELRACSPPLEDVMLYDIVASEYFMKCVEICWYFVIQDPPMYVETVSLKGTKIDKDTHKVYTKSGDIVKYHVWPALYLHHQDGTNGPMMGKGVVQPK